MSETQSPVDPVGTGPSVNVLQVVIPSPAPPGSGVPNAADCHYFHNVKRSPRITLYYDPNSNEGDFDNLHPGEMRGYSSAFAAAIASEIIQDGQSERAIGAGVRKGIISARRLLYNGFGTEIQNVEIRADELFRPLSSADEITKSCELPRKTELHALQSQRSFWRIFAAGDDLFDVAKDYVETGLVAKEAGIPTYGRLLSVDRAEIESYRSIRNLMIQYAKADIAAHPLCMAVFGPPGAGKSFGIKELAASIGNVARIESRGLTWNLAESINADELISAFRRIRDVVLGGNIPLAIFDEFDCRFGNEDCGWLKYFLAPMQDGEFREGEILHPLGRAIFVFAGGTAASYDLLLSRFAENQNWPRM
jgi:hypothetical protein